MFCTKCGASVERAVRFCLSCGAPLFGDEAAGELSDRESPANKDATTPVTDVLSQSPTAVIHDVTVAASEGTSDKNRHAASGSRRHSSLLVGVAIVILFTSLILIIWNSRSEHLPAPSVDENATRGTVSGASSAANLGRNLVDNSNVRTASPQPASTRLSESSAGAGGSPDVYSKPSVIPRAGWGAKAPVGDMSPHSPTRITICHTATLQQPSVSIEEKMQRLQSFSQRPDNLSSGRFKPAWPDVPYHFYVASDGQIAEGRDLRYAGDTNTDYDTAGHILIVLEGNFEVESPTRSQLDSLHRLSAWLVQSFGIPPYLIKEHKDYAPTACPGKNLDEEIARLRQELSR